MTDGEDERARGRRRLNGFLYHLIAYVMVAMLSVVINLLTSDYPWFLLPVVGWAPVLALHVAWVMGLFDVFRR